MNDTNNFLMRAIHKALGLTFLDASIEVKKHESSKEYQPKAHSGNSKKRTSRPKKKFHRQKR